VSYSLFLSVCTTTNLTLGTTFGGQAIATNTENDAKEITRLGLTWWPINNVAFKADYGTVKVGDDKTTEINIGVGYNF